MAQPVRLILVADLEFAGSVTAWLDGIETTAAAADSRTVIQLRAKREQSAARARLFKQAMERCRGSAARVVVNGSLTEAIEAGAAGVHWPETSIPASRPEAPAPEFLFGASVHALGAVERARHAGARYVIAGPVFDAGSKDARGRGLAWLADMARAHAHVIAIGGVTVARTAECLAHGARGVAVISAVFGDARPGARVHALQRALAPLDAGRPGTDNPAP